MELYFYDKKIGHKREDTNTMIRESLSAYISGHSLPPYNGEIKRTEFGKPYIDYPLFIGVTHTDSICIIGIDKENFGIDCESRERSPGKADRIMKSFFAENEREFVSSHKDSAATFLDVWVKKEAFVKFTGEGLSGMKKCDVTLLSGFTKIQNDKNLIIYIYKEQKQ